MATESEPQDESGSAAPKSKKTTTSKGKKTQVSKKGKKGTGTENTKKSHASSSAPTSGQQFYVPSDPVQRLQMINTLSTSLTSSIQNLLSSSLDDTATKSLLHGIKTITASIHSLSGSNNSDGGFVRFTSLPTELRRMIWKFALPGPRVVEVIQVPKTLKKPQKLRLNCDMPAMTHDCSESRIVALEKYSVRLASPTEFPRDFARIDPMQDIIYIRKVHDLRPAHVFSREALRSIQILAMDDWSFDYLDDFRPSIDYQIFPALKELKINRVDPEEDSDYDGDFYDEPYGECMKEHHAPSAVDIRMVNTEYSGEGLADAVLEYMEEMGGFIDEHAELALPNVQVIDVERKERKPRRKYWGF